MSELILHERIKLADKPIIQRLVRERFGYRKHEAYVYIVEPGYTVTLHGGYWSGGSKTDWFEFSLDNQTVLPVQACTSYSDGFKPHTRTVTEATALASTGVFCGKTATMAVYLTQAQAARMGFRVVTAHCA